VSDCFDSTIGARLTREQLDELRQVSWRESELAEFNEDDVKDLGKHTV
jgi:hypothetical protein